MLVNCPHCQKEIQVSTKSLNRFGLVEGTKGDFIANTITKAGVTFSQLLTECDKKFVGQNNVARIIRVINELKNKKAIIEKDGKYILTLAADAK